MNQPIDNPDEPAFTLTISRDGIVEAASNGAHPRIVAHMIRHIADSLDQRADADGLPPIEGHEVCSGAATELETPEEVEALKAAHRAADPRRRAGLN